MPPWRQSPTPRRRTSIRLAFDAFSLSVQTFDGVDTSGGVIAIHVTPVVDIEADTVSTNEDTPIVFNAITGVGGGSADSFENAGRVISSVTQGANGTVSFLPNGQLTYTPNLNWFGNDSFSYTVTSGGVTETVTVNVSVNEVNDPPITIGTIGTQTNNDSDVITPLDVSGFFDDPDTSDVLTYSVTGLPPAW